MRITLTRGITVRDAAGRVRHVVDITNCGWCTDESVCTACHERAKKARAGIRAFDARRAARVTP